MLYKVNRKARTYSEKLLIGVSRHLDEIDAEIAAAARNWRLARLAAVDRNILRIGVYELLYEDGVPGEVAINEAVEVAKKFAAEDSPKFINGVLDAVYLAVKEKR